MATSAPRRLGGSLGMVTTAEGVETAERSKACAVKAATSCRFFFVRRSGRRDRRPARAPGAARAPPDHAARPAPRFMAGSGRARNGRLMRLPRRPIGGADCARPSSPEACAMTESNPISCRTPSPASRSADAFDADTAESSAEPGHDLRTFECPSRHTDLTTMKSDSGRPPMKSKFSASPERPRAKPPPFRTSLPRGAPRMADPTDSASSAQHSAPSRPW